MHFQYIKCWLDRGLINEIKYKKSRYFFVIYNSIITSRNNNYMGLVVRTVTSSNIEILMYKCSTKCIFLKTNGKCADQAWWKKAHSGQYLCYSHATTSFSLMTKIVCAAGRKVPFCD